MTLNEAQVKVDGWIKSYGVRYFSELTNLALLMEETGELARIMARKFGEQSAKSSEPDSSLADEMADILFVLICLANQTGIDLESAFKANLEKKTNRDHMRHHDNDKLKP
jgi:NTP pyrophosphatase (non-canonical NTP hydrolase)